MKNRSGPDTPGGIELSEGNKRERLANSAFRAGPPRQRTPLRDNLESIAIAFLLVLCLRQVVVEAFRIRHGSMAPTLVGEHMELRCPDCGWTFAVGRDKPTQNGEVECPNCHYRWPGASRVDQYGLPLRFRSPEWLWNRAESRAGQVVRGSDAANRVLRGPARIFVNKFIYRLRKPRRWEVTVFLYPVYDAHCRMCDWEGQVHSLEDARCPDCGSDDLDLQAKNFIKRIVGLPGEAMQLRDGDICVNGAISRKPRQIQEGLWFHVFDSRFMPQRKGVRIWDLADAPNRWERNPEKGALAVDALDEEQPVTAAFVPRIADFYSYDGLSYEATGNAYQASGSNTVGDCRIRARARIGECDPQRGAAVLSIDDAGHEFSLLVGVNTIVLEDNGAVIREVTGSGLEPGKAEWICLENYDDRVVARVGGREVFSYEYEGVPGHRHGVELGARAARVLWERVQIERDVFYANVVGGMSGERVYELGEDEYFVLGDNSPASSDSRRWQHPGIPEGNLIGRAFFVFWPVHFMKWLSGGQ